MRRGICDPHHRNGGKPILTRPMRKAADQPRVQDDEHHDRDDQEQVKEAACDVESEVAAGPKKLAVPSSRIPHPNLFSAS